MYQKVPKRKKINEIKDIEKAFEICIGNLTYLPAEYKKWTTLQNYRNQWSFMGDLEMVEAVAEQEMALDYLWSLYKWLQPKLVLKFSHKLIFIHSLATIYEAVLIDLFKYKILKDNKDKFLLIISNHFNKEHFTRLIDMSYKAEIISDSWRDYLLELGQVRNFMHLSKRNYSGRGKLKRDPLFRKSLKDLKRDLIRFRNFIKKRYN